MYSAENKSNHFVEQWSIQQLKQAIHIVNPSQIRVGQLYIYKEKFGMVAMVKVLDMTSENDWFGFRLMIKQVIHSSFQVPKHKIIEVGCNPSLGEYPTSWHFEPGLSLV